MKLRNIIGFAMAGITLMSASIVHAEGAVSLSGEAKVIKVVEDAAGKHETLVEPSSVVPGDRLVFTTHYRNDSSEPVKNFVISNPLPTAVVLTSEEGFEVSIDRGQTFGPLETLKVSAADGSLRPAQLSDVTDVRWTVASIAPGNAGEVKYYATVR